MPPAMSSHRRSHRRPSRPAPTAPRHGLAKAAVTALATITALAAVTAPAAAAPLAAVAVAVPGIASAASATAAAPAAPAPPASPIPLGSALSWRLVGPFRGGRVLAVSGVPGQPETFYFGGVGGAVWRTDDAGRVWTPIFDGPPSGSIGALAVAPSNPNVVYVGTGEADMRSDISYGDGMYRSTDGGRTFQHIGLADSRQIGRILVDPHDPDVVLVAALGHGFGPNPERGVFRSADGGRSWQRVLFRDDRTGAIDLAADPDHPATVYAALWDVHRPPWSVYAPLGGPGSGLFKSTDGGLTWREITGHGLPAGPLGRIGLAVAGGRPGQRGRRVYALIDAPADAGLYRSDDAGETWRRVGADPRITVRGWYFGEVTADPFDPDVVYLPNVSLYRSTDGGTTFTAFRGAPGGDDYHSLWIDPADARRMVLGVDQGTLVTVNGGATWSSWYNQPTAQIYHVATDDRFPYTIYGSQQDSGTVAIASRSDAGQITYRDWFSTGTGESGYLLPDPDDPDFVYGGDTGGHLYRFSRRTNAVQDISPTPDPPGPAGPFRYPWTTALAVSPLPPHALYQASQYVHRSTDHGMSWTFISGDLTAGLPADHARGAAATTSAAAAADGNDQAVIYTLAPSPVRPGQLWVGTDNGLIQVTLDDGGSWQNVTPPGLPPWSLVSLIEASRFDAGTAYAAIDRHQVDDLRPYVLRTRDFGKTWTPIAAGIAAGAYVHAVREDHERRGLLFAGTETGVYFSFDDGDRWQSLQGNLPAASVRDLAVHGDDLIAATHGRSFWVLDGLAPLRQLAPAVLSAPAHLFTPAPAVRLLRGVNRETPLPPETPNGTNPPAGALLDYWLAREPAGDITLEIFDAHGQRVRRFTSADPPLRHDPEQNFPAWWLRPGAPPSKHAGLNRFVWDLAWPPPPALHAEASMDAVYGQDTPFDPRGPLVLPGTYQVRLTAGGSTCTAPLRVDPDPRLTVPAGDLEAQVALSLRLDAALAQSFAAIHRLQDLSQRLADRAGALPQSAASPAGAIAALRAQIARLLDGDPAAADGIGDGLAAVHDTLTGLATSVSLGDGPPTAQAKAAFAALRASLDHQLQAEEALRHNVLPVLNRRLAAGALPPIAAPEPAAPTPP